MATYAPTETDKAYAAGIFDGEGSVNVNRRRCKNGDYTYWITVSVSMVDIEVSAWLFSSFGGHVGRNKRTKSGKQIYLWQLTSRKAADFLERIHPYLKIKGGRAKAAITLARSMRKGGGRLPFTAHATPLTQEEIQVREKLALQIRAANARSQASVAATAKWGIN